tara:strand:- start:74 stop:526 length:453 start_codon:yes stop_codon:yes gene_type:complete
MNKLLSILTQTAGEPASFIFLSTRWEDVIMATGGVFISIIHKFYMDNKKFKSKIAHAAHDQASFRKKYEQDPSYYINNQKWDWGIWWRDNDQDFAVSLGIAVVLIFGIPELSMQVIKSWNALFSILVGAFPIYLFEVLGKKGKDKLEKLL